jgi:hypothetical protein
MKIALGAAQVAQLVDKLSGKCIFCISRNSGFPVPLSHHGRKSCKVASTRLATRRRTCRRLRFENEGASAPSFIPKEKTLCPWSWRRASGASFLGGCGLVVKPNKTAHKPFGPRESSGLCSAQAISS